MGYVSRAAGAAVLFCAPGLAFATPVLTFTPPPNFTAANGDQSVGWQFNVTAPVTVTGLGWFDQNADGLSHAHQVGIWDPAGALLTSGTVPAGAAAGFDGQFRTIPVTPITLVPGNGYIVGGENFAASVDRIASDVPSQTLDPRVSYVDATFSGIGSGFTRPTSFSVAVTGFYGPSFSVPEPSSCVALAVGCAALVARRRRARHVV